MFYMILKRIKIRFGYYRDIIPVALVDIVSCLSITIILVWQCDKSVFKASILHIITGYYARLRVEDAIITKRKYGIIKNGV